MSSRADAMATVEGRWGQGASAHTWRSGHELTLHRGGEALFPAMIEAMDAARHQVWLATYIFHTDPAALRVVDALERAAKRGVRVRVVVDGFGSRETLPWLSTRLRAAGITLTVFRPLQSWVHWFQPDQLRRLHTKLCVVDGEVGFVGGINIIDDLFDLHHGRLTLPRLDYAVQVQGPVVSVMDEAVRALWSRAWLGSDWRSEAQTLARDPKLLRRWRGVVKGLRLPRSARWEARASEPAAGGASAVFVLRDNFSRRRSIEHAYVEAIQSARQRIWLVTPYFYPGRGFRRALCDAAARGVEVKLLLQGRPDYRIAAAAARVLYDELMRSGVQIFEYVQAFLHAKVMVVDEAWATVGSSNIDPLSLLLNLEANVVISDAAFNATLANDLMQAWEASEAITLQRVHARGWASWLRRSVIGGVARAYLRVAGFTGRY